MPHLHLEYTKNLPELCADKVLQRLNHVLLASGQFSNEVDIKSRAVQLDVFRVGTALAERGFVHVKLAILSGRSPEVKKQISESLLAALNEAVQWPAGVDVQLCVEILDIDRDPYSKLHLTA